MPVQWETVITDEQGRVSLHRLRKLSTIVAFWLAIGVVISAALLEVFTQVDVPTDMVMILCGVLIIPITGGQISDAIFGSRVSGKIQAGEAPGRRSGDRLSGPGTLS